MSSKLTNLAFGITNISTRAKLVLCFLADCSDIYGRNRTSLACIAYQCSLSIHDADNAVKELVKSRLLLISPQTIQSKDTLEPFLDYQLLLDPMRQNVETNDHLPPNMILKQAASYVNEVIEEFRKNTEARDFFQKLINLAKISDKKLNENADPDAAIQYCFNELRRYESELIRVIHLENKV